MPGFWDDISASMGSVVAAPPLGLPRRHRAWHIVVYRTFQPPYSVTLWSAAELATVEVAMRGTDRLFHRVAESVDLEGAYEVDPTVAAVIGDQIDALRQADLDRPDPEPSAARDGACAFGWRAGEVVQEFHAFDLDTATAVQSMAALLRGVIARFDDAPARAVSAAFAALLDLPEVEEIEGPPRLFRILPHATAGAVRILAEVVGRIARDEPLLLDVRDLVWIDPVVRSRLSALARRRGFTAWIVSEQSRPLVEELGVVDERLFETEFAAMSAVTRESP
jgi:hypothetical protein